MNQIDAFDGLPSPPPFKDIRNQRSQVADEKARMLLELGRLINKVPPKINSASVQDVRTWRADQSVSMKVARGQRSSKNDISAAINRMRKWW